MLEALEKIKSAEEQNEREKEKLIAELAVYEANKKQLLQEKREELKINFSTVLSEREQELAEGLEAEERELTSGAKEAIKMMEEKYMVKKEQTIQKIIERVISEYGSQ
ncbi:hypothetical protein JZO77_11840 [Enterococcus hulanensis]|uniref:V-type ATP synthase subunit G n=1 Tax=Enterococcus hulanensis TaxID=2559929 RepID=A0ABU3F269_9ENTE|nr:MULTISPECIES: hypothetical protein [Enterococcus]MBO0457423.1 hypothetical protein [Enterococcus hulanensis]MBX8939339.1 hypothetical protein [Enterococcus gilvus]MDT2601228.1 hypothetical protein [Enterococcus hulanensis]MDT2610862.1 hypothetical protein [Enterococcus hulanensis]MDT2618267.1 hypothetical protein [Enterococcus hulanensis]